MAADTAPAAAPGPATPLPPTPAGAPTPPSPTTPAGGRLASLLAPVDPARPHFDLTPTTPGAGTPEGGGQTGAGGSSAAYHGDNDTPGTTTKTTATTQQKGVVRALLLAAAARWAKGGGTANKRLEVKKAQAQAQQVKEARTVTLNQSGGLLGRTGNASNSGTGGGKSGGQSGGKSGTSSSGKKGNGSGNGKEKPGQAVKDPKNSNGSAHQGSGGRSRTGPAGTGPGGSGGRGPGGGAGKGSGGGRGAGADHKTAKDSGTGKRDTPAPKPTQGGQGHSDAKQGGDKAKSDTGKGAGGGTRGGATGTTGGSGGGSSTAAAKPDRTTTAGTGRDIAATTGGGHAPTGKSRWKSLAGLLHPKSGTPRVNNTATPGSPATGNGTQTAAGTGSGRPGAVNTPAAADKTGKATHAHQIPFTARNSRETGYRDGTRAAKAAAHARAYRDGVRDGWDDITQAAARDKARLDHAHAQHQAAREQEPTVPHPRTPTAAPPRPAHPPAPAQPIRVASVTATDVHLGQGADRTTLTRGEVRTLKGFERRLNEKATLMTGISEETRGLQEHAQRQAKHATQLLEAAKSVAGGDKLAAALTRLAEDATVQAGVAAEIHTRALRAAENSRVVLANAETRYGGMYQAVVDSDETAPAELNFYRM